MDRLAECEPNDGGVWTAWQNVSQMLVGYGRGSWPGLAWPGQAGPGRAGPVEVDHGPRVHGPLRVIWQTKTWKDDEKPTKRLNKKRKSF